jgi:hypothetical protein
VTPAGNIIFDNTLQTSGQAAISFAEAALGDLFVMHPVGGAITNANFVSTVAAGTGTAPVLQAEGSDTNPSLVLRGQGSGNVIFQSPVTFKASTTGAVTPSLTNAPTGCTNVIWIGPLSVASPAAAQTVYLAACHT